MNVKKNPLYYVNVGAFLLLSVYSLLVCINVFDRNNIDMNAGLCAVITAMVVCLMMYVIHVARIANMLYSNPIMKVALEIISTLIFLTLSCVIRIYSMGEFELDIAYEAVVLGCIVLAYVIARILNQFGFITLMLLTPWPYIMSGYDFSTADMASVAVVFLVLCVLSVILYFVRRNKNIKIAVICVMLAAIFGYLFYTMHTWNLTSLYVDKITDYIGLFESMFKFNGGSFERYYYIVCIISAIIGGARMWMGAGSANSIMMFAVNMVYFFTITYGIENAFIYAMYPLLAVVASGAFGTRPAYMDKEVELSDNLGSISVGGNKEKVTGTFVDDSELDKMLNNIEEKKGGYQGRTYGATPVSEKSESQDDIPIELQMYDSLASKAEEEKKAAQKAEEEAKRVAEEEAKRQAEEARLAAEAEAKRLAEEKAAAEEAARRAEEEKRIAQQQAETQRLIAEREEAHKAEIARLEAEAAAQRAELERLAAEREAAKKAEEERLAAEKVAAQKAEAERLAAEAEANRKEAERLAEERRIAEELAEQTRAKRLAEEKAAVEKAAAERIAAELAAEQAAAARIAAEQAAAKAREERLAAEKAAAEKFASETINTASFEMPEYNTPDKDSIGNIADLVIEEPSMETMETTIKNNAEAEMPAMEEPEVEEPVMEEPVMEEPEVEEPVVEEPEVEEPVMEEPEAEEIVIDEIAPEFEAEEFITGMPEFEAGEPVTEMSDFVSDELVEETPETEEITEIEPEYEAEEVTEAEPEYETEAVAEAEPEYEAEAVAEIPEPAVEETDEFDVDQFASFDNSGFGFDDQAPEFETMGSFMANNSGNFFPQFETGNQDNSLYKFNIPDDVQEEKNKNADFESSENVENMVQDFDPSQLFSSEIPAEKEESEAVETQPEVVMDYGVDVDEDFGDFFGQAQSLTDFYDMDSQPSFIGEFEEVSLSEPEFEAEENYDSDSVAETETETETAEPEYDNQNSEELGKDSDIDQDYTVEAYDYEQNVEETEIDEKQEIVEEQEITEPEAVYPEAVELEAVEPEVVETEMTSEPEPAKVPEIPTVNPFAKEADYFDWSKVDESEYMDEDYNENESEDEPVKASKNDEYAEFVWTEDMIKELDKNEDTNNSKADEVESFDDNAVFNGEIEPAKEEVELPQEEIAATKEEETRPYDNIPTLNEQEYVAPEEPAQFAVYQPTGNVSATEQDEEQVEQPQFEVFQSSGNYSIEETDEESVDEPQFEVFQSSGNVQEDVIEEIVPEYKTYGDESSEVAVTDTIEEPKKPKTQFDDFEFDLDLPDFEPYDSTKK